MRRKRHRVPARDRGLLLLSLVLALTGGYAINSLDKLDPPQPTRTPDLIAVAEHQVVARVAPAPETQEPELYTDEELELLALVIYQEAGGDACKDETRQMVGEVALNRVEDDRYPDNLAEVLTQRAQYGRLYWTGLVWPERAELPQEAHAVQRAYDCAEGLLSGTSERLLPEDVVFQAEFEQGTEIVAQANGFYFCR